MCPIVLNVIIVGVNQRLDPRFRGNWLYTEPFDTRSQAVRRELEIKSWKSRQAIKELLNNNDGA